MKIQRVTISNFLGIQSLDFEPGGTFTEIRGPNGSGKTSVLTAIRDVLKGGHDASLIRKGEEKAEVVLVLDEGTTIRKRITQKGMTLSVDKGGVKAEKPQTVVDALRDMLSVNPVDFLRAPKRARLDVLLEALPMTADIERLEEIVGHKIKPSWPLGSHALQVIDAVRRSVFEDRTNTNRAALEKRNTISQLKAAIPTDEDGEPIGDLDTLLAERQQLDTAKDAELTRIATKLASLKAESDAREQAIRAERDVKVNALRDQIAALQGQIANANEDANAAIEAERTAFNNVSGKAGQQRQKAVDSHAKAVTPINTAIGVIRENQEAAARVTVTKQTIAAMEEESAQLEVDSDRMTASIEGIDAYKSELLSTLPVDGLEVREGEIFRNDIPFDRLNTAQQVEIAVEIAKLRAGKLGVIAVDGIESLDISHQAEFRDQMSHTGLQMFVARVAGEDFEIHTS